MPSLTDFLTSNLINAAGLDPNVKIEAKIVSVRPREFEDGITKAVVYTDYLGKGIVLNQTRLMALIAAFGTNADNLIGKTIIISLGETTYAGKTTGCVAIEPVVADRIATRGAPTAITSGRVRVSPPSLSEPPPLEHDGGPDDDPDDSIPF
jgi:hypothetical protein